jgi:small subunit ribosomal protein S21
MADSNRQIARSARVVAVPSARRKVVVSNSETSGVVVVKLTLRDRESAQEAVRRFRKLVERSGIKKEMRVREFYEKPSETKRRARLRAQRRARRERFFATH